MRTCIKHGTTYSSQCRECLRANTTRYRERNRERTVWGSMKARCYNPKNQRWEHYGGRGIIVCSRWLDFNKFFEDMGKRPGPEYSIERINNNGNYEPGNVKWAKAKEQTRNRSTNRLLTYNRETYCLAEWAERLGMADTTLSTRLDARGWSIEKALSTPKRRYPKDRGIK